MSPTLVTLVPKIIAYPRAAIGTIAFGVQTTNHPEEFSVSFCSVTLWSCLPCVVATARNLEQPTHHVYWVLVAASIDTQVPYFDSLAKNAAASLKKSRSCLTLANSRLRCVSSSSRLRPWPMKAESP